MSTANMAPHADTGMAGPGPSMPPRGPTTVCLQVWNQGDDAT